MTRLLTIVFIFCIHNLYGQDFWDRSLPPFDNIKDKNISDKEQRKELKSVWDRSLPPFNNIKNNMNISDSLESEDVTYVPQLFISSFFLKRKDSDASLQYSNPVDNISFGLSIYNNTAQKRIYEINRVVLGLTFEDSKTDFRKDYSEPVGDSILISHSQVFARVYNKLGYFVSCMIPLDFQIKDNQNNNMNVDYVRVGVGRTLDINQFFNLDFHYNLLLYPNKDGFRKGFFTFGISKVFNIKLK